MREFFEWWYIDFGWAWAVVPLFTAALVVWLWSRRGRGKK